ncbi:hypothetical protein [Pseudolysinimonas yzui]|uniref:Ig-like domain-containing protein n=1 Tax=Pseudolysinimonas yzui TaxID=2708254 RepID=A0A8J3GSL5_9MICO|nr:hypothetical protein [Pseudolysinimonas yzui]GHF23103.1 hypothetical protein GCM10011600_25390 [Pseudolysinimonas yzui]
MAEFDGLDSRLRDAFAKAAEQGDSTGVADAIRSRIAAGDPGTSVAGGTAPGWGGGVFGWLPWLGLVVLAGIGGSALGASGVIASETREVVAGYTAVLDDSAPAASCPGGPVIGELFAGDRVLAVARSDDSAYLGVRDPNDFARTLWFDRAVVVIDAGQADVDSLPVEACPVVTVEVVAPTPEPTIGPIPIPVPGPAPVPGPSDTTAPKINTATGTPNPLYNLNPLLLRVTAGDGVGVVGVNVSWSGQFTGSSEMSLVKSEWRYTFTPPDPNSGDIHFTFRARDAAGNVSAPVTITIDHQYFG